MIYTSYFASKKNTEIEDAAYLSIAVGRPRYGTPYSLIDFKMISPIGVFKVYQGEEYKEKYIERLEHYGVDRIRSEIERLSDGHKNVVLLCHEKDKSECHRSMFAEWWYSKTGEKILELGEKKEEYEQLSIFQ